MENGLGSCMYACMYSPIFLKFGPHSKIQFENSPRLRHEFFEMLVRPEKAHFCLKFSKNKPKFKKYNPVVAIKRCYEYLLHETINTCPIKRCYTLYIIHWYHTPVVYEIWSKINIYSYPPFSKNSIHLE